MITLILGKKGSGKTKRLMDMCNEAVVQSKGNVLFIEKDNTLTYNLNHKVRLAAADEYAVKGFESLYGFVAGMVMTLIPMVIGFLFAKKICKLPLLNNLGSITGGMTSTPALGTLIGVAGTDDVAAAYASTYPIALVLVVLASQLINTFML